MTNKYHQVGLSSFIPLPLTCIFSLQQQLAHPASQPMEFQTSEGRNWNN